MSLSHFDIVIPSCLYYIWCRIWCQLFYSFLKHNRQFKLILPNGNFRFSIIFFRTHFNIPKPQSMIFGIRFCREQSAIAPASDKFPVKTVFNDNKKHILAPVRTQFDKFSALFLPPAGL